MTYKIFAKLIKEKRIELGLTQKDIAYQIPIPTYTYFKIENGIMEPSFHILSRIAQIFDLDMNEILKEKKTNQNKMYFD